ncbi:hypothetical protein MKW98_022549 [Papaver atlanticum]|uniref:PGG domain-containing protein n=1 Tax=Papaver atlanticum TaxID=357466 RepID=A0AAD4SMK2_9MAGN|nr:hypothetical protein MKW98_022549 [Papaver atlanticum]
MHPKKFPAASYYQEVADDRHTINIPENVLGLHPMAKESDICIPLDRQKETLEASRPGDGDIIQQTRSDEDTKRNDQLAKLFAICLAMATISIAVATAVLFELLPTKMTNLHHPILFKSMAWSGVLSFISSATACGLSYINPHIQFLIRFIEMFLILSFSLTLFTLVIALLIL